MDFHSVTSGQEDFDNFNLFFGVDTQVLNPVEPFPQGAQLLPISLELQRKLTPPPTQPMPPTLEFRNVALVIAEPTVKQTEITLKRTVTEPESEESSSHTDADYLPEKKKKRKADARPNPYEEEEAEIEKLLGEGREEEAQRKIKVLERKKKNRSSSAESRARVRQKLTRAEALEGEHAVLQGKFKELRKQSSLVAKLVIPLLETEGRHKEALEASRSLLKIAKEKASITRQAT